MSAAPLFGPLLCAIVALGAFLLFQLEPLVGKIVTPQFGGTAGVWSVLLLFFQLVIVAGYGLTYGLSKLSGRLQCVVYAALAIGAAAFAWTIGAQPWAGANPLYPESTLLSQLVLHIGLPAIFLATISGIMQIWYREVFQKDPYHLYSYSNAGSMLALMTYPVLVEPNLTIAATESMWRIAFAILSGICCIAAARYTLAGEPPSGRLAPTPEGVAPADVGPSPDGELLDVGARQPSEARAARPITPNTNEVRRRTFQSIRWIVFSAIPSALLLSLTAFLTQDVAPVPLLWIPPLAIYLLTFILAFAGRFDFLRLPLALCTILLAAFFPALDFELVRIPLWPQVLACLALLFCACMMCHLQLYRERPAAEQLPLYYLMVAVGGACGGLAISLVAPFTVNVYLEHCILLVVTIFAGIAISQNQDFEKFRMSIAGQVINPLLTAFAFISVILSFLVQHGGMSNTADIQTERNFYGSVRLVNKRDRLELYHGHILHGLQYTSAAHRYEPASYYLNIVDMIEATTRETLQRPLNMGVIGLGVGTMAAWVKPGDRITFYELDPKIDRIARTRFTFLEHAATPPKIVLGDARQSLAAEAPNRYDFFLIDAFNGDSIPIHLLTLEALRLYQTHVTADGAILFHTSNHYLELAPVLAAAAKQLGMHCLYFNRDNLRYVLLTRNDALYNNLIAAHAKRKPTGVVMEILDTPTVPAWRDDYSNILSVLTFR